MVTQYSEFKEWLGQHSVKSSLDYPECTDYQTYQVKLAQLVSGKYLDSRDLALLTRLTVIFIILFKNFFSTPCRSFPSMFYDKLVTHLCVKTYYSRAILPVEQLLTLSRPKEIIICPYTFHAVLILCSIGEIIWRLKHSNLTWAIKNAHFLSTWDSHIESLWLTSKP